MCVCVCVCVKCEREARGRQEEMCVTYAQHQAYVLLIICRLYGKVQHVATKEQLLLACLCGVFDVIEVLLSISNTHFTLSLHGQMVSIRCMSSCFVYNTLPYHHSCNVDHYFPFVALTSIESLNSYSSTYVFFFSRVFF